MTERELMKWKELGKGTRALAELVVADGYQPGHRARRSRAAACWWRVRSSYALGVKNTFTMNVEFYTGVDERLELPMILPPVPDLVDFDETRVLIADDVADTGATLELVKEFCADKVAEVRCAVLYEKPRSTVQLRVRLAADRPVDHVSVERRRRRRRTCVSTHGGPARVGCIGPGVGYVRSTPGITGLKRRGAHDQEEVLACGDRVR